MRYHLRRPDDPKRETNLEALRRECADLTGVIRDLMLDIPSPTPPEESHP